VARRIVHALESKVPRARYPVTGAAWLAEAAIRFVPARVRDALMVSKVIGREVGPAGTPLPA
jgi:hypothetical protein